MAKAQPKIIVNFRLGRSVGKYDASTSEGSKMLMDGIADFTAGVAVSNIQIKIQGLSKRLMKIISQQLEIAVRYAALNMIGKESRGTPGGTQPATGSLIKISPYDEIQWRPLSARTIKEQAKFNGRPRGPANFFIRTGALRITLLGMAQKIVKSTGVAKIEVKTPDKYKKITAKMERIHIADLRVTLLPKIYPSWLPGIRSGNVMDHSSGMQFEKSLGLSDLTVQKLKGFPYAGDLYHRPLLQPVFTYWTLFEIPKRIGSALQQSIVRGIAGDGSSIYNTGDSGI